MIGRCGRQGVVAWYLERRERAAAAQTEGHEVSKLANMVGQSAMRPQTGASESGAAAKFPAPDVSAVVLAGGHSRRLGQNKALLRVDGQWVLELVVRKLARLSQDVLVVATDAGPLHRLGVRVVTDSPAGYGPVGGVLTGLREMHHARALFVACDMPLLNLGLLRYMIQVSDGHDVVIPRFGEYVEPLHALYHRSCVLHIVDALAQGHRRLASLLGQTCVRYVEREEIETFDPRHLSFLNINTPEDLEKAAGLLRGQSCQAAGSQAQLRAPGW